MVIREKMMDVEVVLSNSNACLKRIERRDFCDVVGFAMLLEICCWWRKKVGVVFEGGGLSKKSDHVILFPFT